MLWLEEVSVYVKVVYERLDVCRVCGVTITVGEEKHSQRIDPQSFVRQILELGSV